MADDRAIIVEEQKNIGISKSFHTRKFQKRFDVISENNFLRNMTHIPNFIAFLSPDSWAIVSATFFCNLSLKLYDKNIQHVSAAISLDCHTVRPPKAALDLHVFRPKVVKILIVILRKERS